MEDSNEALRPPVPKRVALQRNGMDAPLYARLIAELKALGVQEIDLQYPSAAGKVSDPVPHMPCETLFTEAHVNSAGKMSACRLYDGSQFHMGDLGALTFMEAWHGTPYQALRRAHLSGDVRGTACETCIARARPAPRRVKVVQPVALA